MPPTDPVATVNHFSSRLTAERVPLAAQWLARLEKALDVEARDVFPTHQLLDHVPDLLEEIARYLQTPEEEAIAASAAVLERASALGILRFDQQASVHQILREFQIFSEVLEAFFAREAAALGERCDGTAAVLAVSRAQQALRALEQQTVDAFITRYTAAIERQTARLRNFSRLLSHEIRQPLGVLQVLARVLAEHGNQADSAELIESLERNVVRLADVAGKLERLARLTRPLQEGPNDQGIDFATLVGDVISQVSEMADARGVALEVGEHLPTFIVDAGRVELMLINLIVNAVKYSDPAKPSRHVVVEGDASVAHPRIRIRDNGIGIPRSKLELIFDQFVRVHPHLDGELNAEGMGLGLSIVRECMDAMGGAVQVESVAGEGTTFTLEWPNARRLPPPTQ